MNILLNNTFPSGYGFLSDTLGLQEKTIVAIGLTVLAGGILGAYCVSPKVRSLFDRCIFGQPSRNQRVLQEVRTNGGQKAIEDASTEWKPGEIPDVWIKNLKMQIRATYANHN